MSAAEPNETIEVRRLQVEEAPQFAALQRRVFPDFNSSKLGQGFCTALYRVYALRADAYGFGAWRGAALLGLFIACHRDVEAEIQRSLRGRALLALLLRPHLLCNRAVVARGLRVVRRRCGAHAEAPVDETCIRFITMGVAPEARRLGLATRLSEATQAEALRRGFRFAEAWVYATNHVTRRHWEKMGWVAGVEPPGGRGAVRYLGALRRTASANAAAGGQGAMS